MSAIHFAAQNLATIIVLRTTKTTVLRILEARELATEGEQHVARSTFTMLGYDNLRHTTQVATIVVLIDMVVLRTVDEQHHIGILLDGSRLTQVGQLRTFALQSLTTLNTTVQLRQRQDGNIQLLGQSLQRTRDDRHLLLTRREAHAVGIHQLQVVNHDNLHAMLANQTAGLGTQLENGETRGIVDVKRCTQQVVDALVQAVPLIRLQLTVQNLRTLNLTGIRDETVYQLHVRHFEREESHRHLVVGSNVLGHREGKRRLTHGRTTGNNHKVAGLPAAGDVVQLVIARRYTRQAVLVGCGLLDDIDGVLDNGVYLGVVLLHVALSQFEQRTLGLLHQIVDINGLVEGLGLDIAGKGNELTGQRLLGNNTGMVLNIGRRSHTAGEFRHIARATDILKVALTGQLFSHRPNVDRRLV